MKGNTNQAKREERFAVHNRKPGAGKFWKQKNNRGSRRYMSRVRKTWVQQRS